MRRLFFPVSNNAFYGTTMQTSHRLRFFFYSTFLVACIAAVVGAYLLFPGILIPSPVAKTVSQLPQIAPSGSQNVLATQDSHVTGKITFNIPAFFNEPVTFKKGINVEGDATFSGTTTFNGNINITNHDLSLGTGRLTAANVLYSLTGGAGVAVTSGQTPTISNTGVLSFQGQTGSVTLTAGDGIQIQGTTITNTKPNSIPNLFSTIAVGSTNFSAGSTSDTLTFAGGTGISIAIDTTNKKLTVNATGGTGTVTGSGFTTNGVMYATGSTGITSLTPGTSGFILQSNGAGSPPSWVVNSGNSPAFSAITSGTNTSAAMLVGSGASLNFTGSGTLNASTLLGGTWAIPGAIGATTSNTGTFTALTGSGAITFSGLSAGIAHIATGGLISSSAVGLGTGDVTGVLPVGNGGTNAITPSAARTNLGAAASGTNTDITSLGGLTTALSVGQGGTGLITLPAGSLLYGNGASAMNSLGIGGANTVLTSSGSIPQWSTSLNLAGSLTVGTTTTLNGITYTWPGVQGNSQILQTNGSGTLSWVSSSSVGVNFWQLNNGVLSPLTNTNTLSVGTTGSLATLDVRALNGIEPVASISGKTSFASLVVDNSGFGDIFAASSSGQNRFVITQNGNVGVGTTTPSNLLQVAGTIGLQNSQTFTGVTNFTQFSNGISVGGATTYNIANTGVANLFSGSNVTNSGASYFQVGSSAGSGSFGRLYADFTRFGDFALTDGNANSFFYAYAGSALSGIPIGSIGLGLNVTSPHAVVDVEGGNTGGNAALIVNQTGANTNDIFDASSSGNTKFVINNSGSVGIGTAAPGAALDVNGSLLLGANSTIDARSSGSLTIGNGANTTGLTLGKSGATTTFNSTSWTATPTISGLVTANGGLTVASGQTLTLAGTSNQAVFGTGTTGTLTWTPATTNKSITIPNANGTVAVSASGAVALDSAGNITCSTCVTSSSTLFTLAGTSGSSQTVTSGNTVTLVAGTNITTTGAAGPQVTIATVSNPTFSTSVTSPLKIGGTTASSTLTLESTSGTGTSDYLAFLTGSQKERLRIDTSGNLGFNTSSPLSLFDIRGNNVNGTNIMSGTISVASISGATSFAGLVVDNSGVGDIFTASSSGLTRFVLGQNGTFQTNGATATVGYNRIGSSLSTNGLSSANDLFISGKLEVSNALLVDSSIIEAGSQGTVGWLQRNLGTLSPTNITDDLVLGGTATASAKIGFLNLASGTPTATISSNLSLQVPTGSNPSATFNVLNGGSLNFQTATTGQADAGLTSRLFIANSGNIGIDTNNPTAPLDISYASANSSVTTPAFIVDNPTGGTATALVLDTAGTKRLQLDTNTAGQSFFSGGSGTMFLGYTRLNTPGGMNFRNGDMFLDSTGKFGIGTNAGTNLATLDIRPSLESGANSGTIAIASISGQTSLASLVVDNSGKGDIFTASSSGRNRFVITQAGNVGIGTTTPIDLLDVEGGNIRIGAQTNSSLATQQTFTKISQATAGTIAVSGTASIASISATAVYNGSLYVGTSLAGSAEVYRYNGTSGSWTKVSQATAGTIAAAGTSAIDMISSMTVYNGYLYIGTQKTAAAEIYQYGGGTSWSVVSQATAGTIAAAGTSAIDGVASLAVYGGKLYAGTRAAARAELYRYDGGTTWQVINSTPGEFNASSLTCDQVSSIAEYNGNLIIGTAKAGGADLLRYTGATGTTPFLKLNSNTQGTFGGAQAAIDDVSSLIVYEGKLYIGTRKSGKAEILKAEDNNLNTTPVSFSEVSSVAGTVASGGTSSIDGIISMVVYNGRLYAATRKSATGEVYRYEGNYGSWTRVSGGGTFDGNTTSIDSAGVLQTYNGNLIVGTDKAASAEVYQYTSLIDQSFALKFHAPTAIGGGEQNSLTNDGSIYFVASTSSILNSRDAQTGTFVFSNSITTDFGAYDYAEDYGTRDDTLVPGDIVAMDPNEQQLVKKAAPGDGVIGIYSENPGFRLSQQDTTISGGRAIPIALAGRVPVKVSTENGPIHIGDLLTMSSIPGVAMKATKPGFMIARSFADYDVSDKTAIGKIMAFVMISWADPSIQLTSSGNLNIADSLPSSVPMTSSLAIQDIINASDSTNANQTSMGSQSPLVMIHQLALSMDSIVLENASISANLSSINTALTNVDNRLTTLEKTGLATSSAIPFADTLGIATVSGDLHVAGKSLFSDVGITGTFNMGLLRIDGLDMSGATSSATINTLSGSLNLQSLGLGNVEIGTDKIIFDTDGNMQINAGVIKGNDLFRDVVTLPIGETTATVNKAWPTTPVTVNVTPNYDTTSWVDNITKDGFTIHVGTSSAKIRQLYWMALW